MSSECQLCCPHLPHSRATANRELIERPQFCLGFKVQQMGLGLTFGREGSPLSGWAHLPTNPSLFHPTLATKHSILVFSLVTPLSKSPVTIGLVLHSRTKLYVPLKLLTKAQGTSTSFDTMDSYEAHSGYQDKN